ncbi:MAG: amino acid adenylation domain-containing protein [Phycisphaerales bacterium]|nr:amino acid adenylation domain-containing protein [Phycisphaerales bacterium]
MPVPHGDPPALLHDYFRRAAHRHPNGVAIDVPPGIDRPERRQVTFAELDREAGALASAIRPLADHRECIAAILLPRTGHELYAAQLACLLAGIAYTCVDPSFPDEHLRAVLHDAEAIALLTNIDGAVRAKAMGLANPPVLDVPSFLATAAANGAASSAGATPEPLPTSLAYLIYTSGTTGQPKGVMIEHRSIANLVASDLDEFGLGPGDRVAQGSSAAYDSSLEETWLALASGATLVVMDDDTVRLGPDLVAWLRRERITVLCPPPTLLRTTGCTDPRSALPDLRLLYVGGEPLTEDVVERWAPGRRMENGYGPTECTVTVVRTTVRQGQSVAIGHPVSGNQAWVLDANLDEVTDGSEGELCIGGLGLARGYRHRPELTAERFPNHPRLGRIYRTGDLVRRDPDGTLAYLGRIDAQVKLRGYRVELGAVEAHLARCAGVREAACRVQGPPAEPVLVAFVVPERLECPPAPDVLKAALRRALPPYMVPSRIGYLPSLPTTVGGKLDRRALPELGEPESEPTREVTVPCNALERAIVAAFSTATRADRAVSTDEDFFLDLGGDSLSAVGAICALREHPSTAWITVRDLYEARTAAALAARRPTVALDRSLRPNLPAVGSVGAAQVAWTTTAQGGLLLATTILGSLLSYALVFQVLPWAFASLGVFATLAAAPAIGTVLAGLAAPLAIATLAILKRMLIGRYEAGAVPVWSGAYLRHWIVEQFARLVPWGTLSGTVFLGAALRALGADIGQRVHIHRGVSLQRGGWDLLTIGDDATIGQDARLGLVELDSGCLVIAPVAIGAGATMDVRAGVGGGATVEPGGWLTPLSWLPSGRTLPANERWNGVPATLDGPAPPTPTVQGAASIPPWVHGLLLIGALAVRRTIGWLPIALVVALVADAQGVSAPRTLDWLLDSAPGLSGHIGLGVLTAIAVALVPLALLVQGLGMRALGSVRSGVFSQWSIASIRIWIKTGELEAAGRWLSGSLYWPWWLRLAGMRIGRGCEVSSIIDTVPERVEIGAESFLADGIYLAGPHRRRGTVTVADTRLGRDTFLGNHAVVPGGAQLPDDYFAGVSTVAADATAEPGTAWFGHPALALPRRSVVNVDRQLTHEPTLVRRANRVFWETLRFALPAPAVLALAAWYRAIDAVPATVDWSIRLLVVVPAATVAAIGSLVALVVVLKWLLLGRVRPGQHALWSCWCSRWDFLYVAWRFLAAAPLSLLEGTLLLPVVLRAIGVRIGRRVVLGPGFAQVVDPDMLAFEDGATVNAMFQAHSFEDRVLKIDRVAVRRDATIGSAAVVFYGADVGEGAWVAPHSVVMKNDRIDAGSACAGCPAQPVG